MTFEKFRARRHMVSNLGTALMLMIAAEMSGRVVEMIVVGVYQVDGSQGFGFEVWRWTAWIPVALYVVTIGINMPLPSTKHPEVRWYWNGRARIPEFGRGHLVFVGVLLAIFGSLHSVMFLPDYADGGAASVVLQDVILAALGVLLLRIVLGWLRLVPRSWRVEPDPPGRSREVPLRIPAQRFAPPRGTGAG